MEKLKQYDYEIVWRGIFDSLGQLTPQEVSEKERFMMETLVLHQHLGMSKKKDAIKYGNRKTVRYAIKIVKLKDSIHEKGLRYLLKTVRKKMNDCFRDNGFWYTFRKVKEKLFG